MPLTLEITEGHSKGASFTFTEPANFLVGRDTEAHFRLPENDRYFSRRHFIIEISPPCYRLIDLKSRSGTLVNGVRVVESIDLKDKDVIQGGQTKMIVRIDPESAETLIPESFPAVPATVPQTGLHLNIGTTAQQFLPNAHDLDAKGPLSIPGCRLIGELGRGGMGVVYRGVRESDNRDVAIKTIHPELRPSQHAVSRFLREAEITRKLQHPGIVAGLDSGESRGTLWLAMDFIDGRDGLKILKSDGPLAIPRAVEWMRQLLDALGHAHERDLVHRDVKPANILITQTSAGEKVHLTDFGLARAYQVSMMSGLTVRGNTLGTVKFMPLEQVLDARTVKPPADQYAAAATLYQLLTGQFLFENARTEMEWYVAILEANPTPIQKHRPEVSDALAKTIHRALARKPEDRFRDVNEFSKSLVQAIC